MQRINAQGDVVAALGKFPGAGRRFERLADNLYTDYAVHPREIKATIAMARELSSDVTVVYQPHQNVRQHEVASGYTTEVFASASELYWVPTYQTREDPSLPILTPADLTANVHHNNLHFVELDDNLWQNIQAARNRGSLVLIMGAGPIDSWLRGQVNSGHNQ
jgi:UDP-N-acetylmuramate--alanine ligase